MLCVHDDLRRDLSVPLSRGTTSLVIEEFELIDGLLFGLISTSSLKLTLLCLLESLRIPFGGSASNVSPSEPWIWIWTWFLQEHGKWNRRGKYKKVPYPGTSRLAILAWFGCREMLSATMTITTWAPNFLSYQEDYDGRSGPTSEQHPHPASRHNH